MSNVFVLNCGSSSLKFVVMQPETGEVFLKGLAERLGQAGAVVAFKFPDGSSRSDDLNGGDHQSAIEAVWQELGRLNLVDSVRAVGHRVVHGGEKFHQSCLITDEVISEIQACIPLAPLHNPANLTGIFAARANLPHLPHVAVFDTAFHQTMPAHAFLYAIPKRFYEEFSARRYGFHGTSHRFIAQRTAEFLQVPADKICLISAHLGNGSSACAILNGQSVDTTMGLTPLEGLVMGSRSGDLDPGLIPFLCDVLKTDAHGINQILNKESGLLGLSGLSNDCRELLEAEAQGHEGAKIALAVFVHRLAKSMAALMTSLPRVDALVFTGGIGENAAVLRARTLERLAIFGYRVDEAANMRCIRGEQGIISAEATPKVLVLGTDEERMIANDTLACCA